MTIRKERVQLFRDGNTKEKILQTKKNIILFFQIYKIFNVICLYLAKNIFV